MLVLVGNSKDLDLMNMVQRLSVYTEHNSLIQSLFIYLKPSCDLELSNQLDYEDSETSGMWFLSSRTSEIGGTTEGNSSLGLDDSKVSKGEMWDIRLD